MGVDVATLLAQYEHAPATEPMHGKPGEVRRNPSTDQKKVRRTMTKSAADQAQTESIPELLARAASAKTQAEQEQLMAEVEQRTSARYAAYDAGRALDLSVKEAVEIVPRGLHELHTAATDWLMGEGMHVTASATDAEHALVAEASMWFQRCPDFVKEDAEEFRVQASNLARRTASQYGEQAERAAAAFMAEVDRLYRQGQRTGSIKTAAVIHDLVNGGLVDDVTPNHAPADPAAQDRSTSAPGHPPVDGHPGGHSVDTSLPGTHDLASHTPSTNSEIQRHMTGQDAAGVGDAARGYAQHVVGARQVTAAHRIEDEAMGAALAGFDVTAAGVGVGAAGAELGEAKGMPGGGMPDLGGAVDSAERALDSSSDGVRDASENFARSQVTGASSLPQADQGATLHDTFPSYGPGYPGEDTSSNRAPSLQEIQNYTGWTGTSVVPPGSPGATGMNNDQEPTKDFAGTQGFPVSGSTHAAKVAAKLTKESSMDYAACPHCAGQGRVAVRHQAYSGLPQVDQIVNADETPGATPLPTDVAFGLEGWGASPQQGAQNVQNSVQQAEQQISERNAKSPLMTTGGYHVANGRDNSGWIGDMGAQGTDYPGYSAPQGYDGSNNLGQPDPVYGYGGDNGNQPLQPYGEMEANDETNNPSQPYDPSATHDAGQGYRSVSPGLNTQGSYHPDPVIAAAQRQIAQRNFELRGY